MNGEIQLLKDPFTEPTDIALSVALKDIYPVYGEFVRRQSALGVEPEWRYYNDGKAWLCKNVYRKKTVFWLSVWEGFFKLSLYFTAVTAPGLESLDVPPALKAVKPAVGKLVPLVIDIGKDADLDAVFKIIDL